MPAELSLVDTNVLVYAVLRDSAKHPAGRVRAASEAKLAAAVGSAAARRIAAFNADQGGAAQP